MYNLFQTFLLLLQQYSMQYILYNNCNNFVIYKMIRIIVIILEPSVLKRTWNWGDNAVKVVTRDLHNVKDKEWSRIDRHDSKLDCSPGDLQCTTASYASCFCFGVVVFLWGVVNILPPPPPSLEDFWLRHCPQVTDPWKLNWQSGAQLYLELLCQSHATFENTQIF